MTDKLQATEGTTPSRHEPPLAAVRRGAGEPGAGRPTHRSPCPTCGPDELLVRHDACGLCFSDIKVIKLGQQHPRIFRDIQKDPVVLGHEVSLTVVDVGEQPARTSTGSAIASSSRPRST